MHLNCSVDIKVGIFKYYFTHGCGVKQGDNLAPTLFILAMQIATQELAKEFDSHGVDILNAFMSSSENCVIKKQRCTNISKLSTTAILILLCLDDGALYFGSRDDVVLGTQLCIDVFAKFGLIIHTGKRGRCQKLKRCSFLAL